MKVPKFFVGIDPGKNGGIAVLNSVGMLVATAKFDKLNYIKVLKNHLAYVHTDECINVTVEKVHAMPGQGVVSMFSFGENFGYIEGILATLDIPVTYVEPKKWKKALGLSKDKEESIKLAQKLYPHASLLATLRSRKPHDGIAEAILLAVYGRRLYYGDL